MTEYVRPLRPASDEAAALELTEGTAILETTRITTAGRRAVLAETERATAHGIQNCNRI